MSLGEFPFNLLPPDAIEGEVHCFSVPDEQRRSLEDIPRCYAVIECQEADGGCVVWGWYREEWDSADGRWIPNVSARWLVLNLLKSLTTERG